jgi:hypothetical protein
MIIERVCRTSRYVRVRRMFIGTIFMSHRDVNMANRIGW